MAEKDYYPVGSSMFTIENSVSSDHIMLRVNNTKWRLTFTVAKTISSVSSRAHASVATLIVSAVGILNTQIQLKNTLIDILTKLIGNDNFLRSINFLINGRERLLSGWLLNVYH